MKRLFLFLTLVMACMGAARAESFTFSYHFADSNVVSGSFNGERVIGSADLVRVIDNLNWTYGGFDTAFLYGEFGTDLFSATPMMEETQLSFSGRANNLWAVQIYAPSALLVHSQQIDFQSGLSVGGDTAFATLYDYKGADKPPLMTTSFDSLCSRCAAPYDAARWTLSASMTSAVPENETYAMLLAGLGVMGAVARRRKAKQA